MLCERAFLPDDVDREDLERTGQPLTSSRAGATCAASTCSPSPSPSRTTTSTSCRCCAWPGSRCARADRGPQRPAGVLGGAAVFLNPEPLAPFADLIAVGEGEALVPRMMEALLGAADPRAGPRRACTEKDGFYVPVALRGALPRGRHGGRLRRARAASIRQRGWPGKMALPQSVILTPNTEMSMKFMVEISRGCPCMCRFCWAGYNYLPVRGFSRAADRGPRARGARRHANKIGLVSTAVCDHPEIDGIVDDLAGLGYEVSVASLRLDDLTPEFVFKLADTGVQGLTLAPECGTDRMRRILNKQFTNDGHPRPRHLDLRERDPEPEALLHGRAALGESTRTWRGSSTLTEQIRERMIEVGRARGRVGRIHPSVNPFVPKPGTPYQWLPMEDPKETDRKLQFLRKAFGRMPNVDAICKSARTGVVAVDPGPGRPARGRRPRARGRARAWT